MVSLQPWSPALSMDHDGGDDTLYSTCVLLTPLCDLGDPKYRSATSRVFEAMDYVLSGMNALTEVALKIVTNPDHMRDEVMIRYNKGKPLNEAFVLGVLRVHVPAHEKDKWIQTFSDVEKTRAELGQPPLIAKEASPENEYVMVLPLAERSLDQVMSMERLAGTNHAGIMEVATFVAEGLQYLHKEGLIHGDVKRKNVMRMSKAVWSLIDMDAAVKIGQPLGLKFSEAMIAPEYMQVLLPHRTNGRPAVGHPTITAVCCLAHNVHHPLDRCLLGSILRCVGLWSAAA